MSVPRILAAALGLVAPLGTADASAARCRDRHPGHHPHASTATCTVPVRPSVRVLRMARGAPRGALGSRTAYACPASSSRFAQAPRHHALMRGIQPLPAAP